MQNASNKYAILIGINGYHESLGRLKYCVNDVRRLADVLTQGEDAFPKDRLLVLTDDGEQDKCPTYANIHSWLASYLAQADDDDTVFVYFAGHGREHGGKAYLLPSDATLQTVHVTGIPVSYVQELLERCKARQKVLVLDACHSGAGRDVAAMSTGMLNELSGGKGIYTITSCDADELSHEWGDKKHGVFSYFLSEGLAGGCPPDAQNRMTAEALYEWVYDRVRNWARNHRCTQTPKRFSAGSGAVVLGLPKGNDATPAQQARDSSEDADRGENDAETTNLDAIGGPNPGLIDPAEEAFWLRHTDLDKSKADEIMRIRARGARLPDHGTTKRCELCGAWANWASKANPRSKQCRFCGRWVITSWCMKNGLFSRRTREPHSCWVSEIGACSVCAGILRGSVVLDPALVARIKRFHPVDEKPKDGKHEYVCERCGAWADWGVKDKPLTIQCPYCGRWVFNKKTKSGYWEEHTCWQKETGCCDDCRHVLCAKGVETSEQADDQS